MTYTCRDVININVTPHSWSHSVLDQLTWNILSTTTLLLVPQALCQAHSKSLVCAC